MRGNTLPNSKPVTSLSLAETKRIALVAQGFSAKRTVATSSWRRVEATIEQLGLLQLDSISVLVRAHYFPVFSRVGAYDREALDKRAFLTKNRNLFEYWAHEASLLPLSFHPQMRWRMQRAEKLIGIYSGLAKFVRDERSFISGVYREIASRGAVSASELGGAEKRTSSWWGWNRTKAALEFLFWTGAITVACRRGFERVYDLTERVLPDGTLSLPTPNENEAIRSLALFAGRALGVATEVDIRDYFRMPAAETRQALAELVEDGALVPADVETWQQPGFLDPLADSPKSVGPTCLVSPFDPLIWHRPRSERLFNLHYRIEIYVPAEKRRHGYYVLPFLHNGRFRARVDLKADRVGRVLSVKATHLEPDASESRTAVALAHELKRLANWLDLADIRVDRKGDLAGRLAKFF